MEVSVLFFQAFSLMPMLHMQSSAGARKAMQMSQGSYRSLVAKEGRYGVVGTVANENALPTQTKEGSKLPSFNGAHLGCHTSDFL